MKFTGSWLICASVLVVGVGCRARNSRDEAKSGVAEPAMQSGSEGQSDSEKQSDSASRVQFLKNSIKEIALRYRPQSDVLESIDKARAEMIPLIAELVTLVPAKKPIDMVPQLHGVWKALWRDEDITLRRDVSGTLNNGVRVLPDQAYQGFFANDQAYVNFANSEVTRKDPTTGVESKTVAAGFLFATFTPTENFNKAHFRAVYNRKKPLEVSEDLLALTSSIWEAHKLTQSADEADKAKGAEKSADRVLFSTGSVSRRTHSYETAGRG